MIRAILWKETREHLVTFLVLGLGTGSLVFAGSLLFSLDPGFTGSQQANILGMLLGLLTIFTAVLTGALLTGSDNERKTSPWLESLPGSALKRWGAQVCFALILQAAMVFLWFGVWLILYWNHLEKTNDSTISVVILTLSTLSCLAWGQWGGFRSKTVLGGFGTGMLGLGGALVAIALLLTLAGICVQMYRYFFPSPINPTHNDFLFPFLVLTFGIILPLGLVIRKLVRTDRQWALLNLPAIQVLRRWSWLIGKTNTVLTLVLLALGILAGFLLPHLFLAWPVWGLVCGVLGGLMILAPDQDGEKQFVGSMRSFTPFQFDLRVGISFLLSLAMLGAPMVIPIVSGIAEWTTTEGERLFQTRLIQMVWPGVATLFPLVVWLLLWWACGFGAGLWTSLFFDKWIVSFVVSLGLGTLISTLWLPSFFGGQLSFLWILALVLSFWGLSRYLYRGFCAGTIHEKGLSAFGLMLLVIGSLSIVAFVSRFIFLEGTTPPYDIAKISKDLTNPNPKLVDDVRSHINFLYETRLIPYDLLQAPDKPVFEWSEKDNEFFEKDYQKLHPEILLPWKTPNEVISLFVANNGNFSELDSKLIESPYRIWEISKLRVFHGLWLAQKGKPGEFPEELNRTLYLAACMKHKGQLRYETMGEDLEKFVCRILENYLLHGNPDEKTLREIVRVQEIHESRLKQVQLMSAEVGYFLSIRSLDNLMNYTSLYLGDSGSSQNPAVRLYWHIYNLAMKAPWEMERKRRLINHWFQPASQLDGPKDVKDMIDFSVTIPFWYLNPDQHYRDGNSNKYQESLNRNQTLWSLTRIGVAAKRYQLAKKEFPKTLEDLVPGYLPSLPTDSFTGAAFQMRIVQKGKPGEKKPSLSVSSPGGEDDPQSPPPVGQNPAMMGAGMGSPAGFGPNPEPDPFLIDRSNKMIPVKPGTLVLWSIGLDGISQGGSIDGQGYQIQQYTPNRSDDMLFLVGP